MTHEYKVGDAVFIRNRNGPMTKATVEKVTATQVTAGGRRFKIDTGKEIGGSDYWTKYIYPSTPELAEQQDKLRQVANAKAGLRKVADMISRVDGDDAVAMWDALPDAIKAKVMGGGGMIVRTKRYLIKTITDDGLIKDATNRWGDLISYGEDSEEACWQLIEREAQKKWGGNDWMFPVGFIVVCEWQVAYQKDDQE